MIHRGRVKDGVVILEEDVNLPDGTEVSVAPVETPGEDRTVKEGPSLYERLKPVIGSAKGLPSDASKNVDKYLYGSDDRQ